MTKLKFAKKIYFIFSFLSIYILGQAQVIFGTNDYIQYHIGSLPIIISVPHGGLVTPTSIPDRTCNNPTTVWDNNTIELGRLMDTALFNLTGCRPHLIICNLRRTKIDCNRNIADGACGNSQAEIAWTEFSDFIDTAQFIAKKQFSNQAFYIDLHAHGHTNQRLELGYGLTGAFLKNTDSVLNLNSSLANSSLKNLVSTNTSSSSHAQLLRGPEALGTLLSNAGFPAVPSLNTPHPDTFPYFNGGYNTFNHTCIAAGNTINGLQIETPSTVFNGLSNRKKFADSIAIVLVKFLSYHQNIQFSDCKRRPPVLANIPNQNSTIGNLYNLYMNPFVTRTNGDSILSYSISGLLPIGLSFDSTNGIISGTPSSVGNSSLMIKCKDVDGYSNTDTFLITINLKPNQSPKANNDTFSLNDGTIILINPRNNDTDSDGDSLEISFISSISKGTISIINAGKNIQYKAPLNYSGLVSCNYVIIDSKGGSDSAFINFKITDTATIANSILPILGEEIIIYPNPVLNILEFSTENINGNYEFLINNTLGELVLKASNQNRLNVSLLKSGLYFISITDKQNRVWKSKMIKE